MPSLRRHQLSVAFLFGGNTRETKLGFGASKKAANEALGRNDDNKRELFYTYLEGTLGLGGT